MSATTGLRLPRVLGAESAPATQLVDARWLMAYAAGLGESDARFYDTEAPGGPLAHPLFPVCYEWPPLVDLRERTIGDALAPFSVHATHDLRIARLPRAGETVTTRARVVAVERRRAGALLVARLTTVDARGGVLTTTDYGSVYRGVDAGEPGRVADPLPAVPAAGGETVAWSEPVALAPEAAHVYTECARIWNPIHTDVAVAHAAGLPAIILHGTATLALAVSRVVARDLAGDAAAVRGIAARFTGFVRLPSALTVRGRGRAGTSIAFDAVGPDAASVLGEGRLTV
ncbi:MAG: MaoC family dehydratase N-terminal domain-containing protein [Candidatus Rokubacteria bacterium]|nr:MaoC family dehydratase N-terminal domain-containing protein [Candidatus Rokubacteria bacterium]